MSIRLVYVAGRYRAQTTWRVEQNIRAAEEVGAHVAQLGAYPVIPHSNTRGYFESFQPGEFWLEATLALMRRCDAVMLVKNWEGSTGARAEVDEATFIGLPVFEDLAELAAWLKDPVRDMHARVRLGGHIDDPDQDIEPSVGDQP